VFIYLVSLVGFFFYGVFAYLDGDPNRLIYGMDIRSEICGVGKLEEKALVYYINPVVDIDLKICIEKCPDLSGPDICIYNEVDPYVLTPFCYTQI